MRIFVTGATGWVGFEVVKELINAGHQVLGLVRSDANEAKLKQAGGEALRGELKDLDILRHGAETTDGVIHTAFIHDWSNFKACCEADKLAIETFGAVLKGSNRPLVVSSGVGLLSPGVVSTEQSTHEFNPAFPRLSDILPTQLAEQGINAMAVRLPPTTHGQGEHGFSTMVIASAREKGVSAYVGDGSNRWPATHCKDAAKVYRLAVEKGTRGAHYHAIAEQGVPFREIATIIGKRLNLPVVSKTPEQAAEHFGWFSRFAGLDMPSSSEWTRRELGWQPTHIGLLEDLDHDYYFKA